MKGTKVKFEVGKKYYAAYDIYHFAVVCENVTECFVTFRACKSVMGKPRVFRVKKRTESDGMEYAYIEHSFVNYVVIADQAEPIL